MKRVGKRWETICSFENLLFAAHQSSKGKRFRFDVLCFHYDLEGQIWTLKRELEAGVYEPGDCQFYVFEPKKRLISAAPYSGRVVHHALTQVLNPIFEPSFVFDSYACRRHKGTHAAVDRAQCFARKHQRIRS